MDGRSSLDTYLHVSYCRTMREEILRLARNQLESGGYENLSFAAIADSLSTTRANIHYHFKNKEGLATEAAKAHIAEELDLMRSVARKHRDDFVAFISDIEARLVSMIKKKRDSKIDICSQLIRTDGVPPELTTLAQNHFKDIRDICEEVIIASQRAGTMKTAPHAADVAAQGVAMMLGVIQLAIVYNNQGADSSERVNGLLTGWVRSYA